MSRERARLLTVLAFAALILAPPALAAGALVAGAVVVGALRSGRLLAAWHGRRSAAHAGRDGVVLGADASGRPVVVSDRELSAHGLILGASGAGKTTTVLRILTDHIQRGRPVIAIDLKGSPEFARVLAAAAADAGRPFAIWTPDGPSHWNPLGHGNATELKDKLLATERFTEPHYQRAAERYLQAVMNVLSHAHPGTDPTLERVVELMDPRRIPAALRGVPAAFAARTMDYLSSLSPDQLSAIRGLGTRLAILTESHTAPYLAPPAARDAAATEIDVHRALAGGEVVLFSLNSARYGQLAAQLGTLVVQDLVSAAGRRLEAPGPHPRATIAVDEFSALGRDHLVALLARGREAGLSVLLVTQELADLDRAATGLRDQVLGNTAVKVAHRQDVPDSAYTVAQLAGTETAWEVTQQIRGLLLPGLDAGRGTRRQVEKFVVEPNEIKRLPTGDAVLISKLSRSRARTIRVTRPERGGPERS